MCCSSPGQDELASLLSTLAKHKADEITAELSQQIISDVNKQCEILSFNSEFQVKCPPGLDAQAYAKRHNVIADDALVELFARVRSAQLLRF